MPMFLVKDRRLGMDHYVFTHIDPRTDGYPGDVIDGVTLDYDMNAVHRWPNGQPRPQPQYALLYLNQLRRCLLLPLRHGSQLGAGGGGLVLRGLQRRVQSGLGLARLARRLHLGRRVWLSAACRSSWHN